MRMTTKQWGCATYIYVKEVLGVIQPLHTDLQSSSMAFAPTDHVATEALAWLQSADTSIELGSQPCARGLQDPVRALYLPHDCSEQLLHLTPANTEKTAEIKAGIKHKTPLNISDCWLVMLCGATEAAIKLRGLTPVIQVMTGLTSFCTFHFKTSLFVSVRAPFIIRVTHNVDIWKTNS